MEINDAVLSAALLKIKSIEAASIPDSDNINHRFSEDFENRIKELINSLNTDNKQHHILRNILTKAAIITLTALAGIISVIMFNPNARAEFTNAIIEFYENHIKFHFITGEMQTDDFVNYEKIYSDYIPYGFELKEKYLEYEAVGFIYENKSENLNYEIYISLNDGLSVHTDLPENNIEKIRLNDKEAYLIIDTADGKPYSTLIMSGNKITVTIYGQINREEIIKIGKSIKEE